MCRKSGSLVLNQHHAIDRRPFNVKKKFRHHKRAVVVFYFWQQFYRCMSSSQLVVGTTQLFAKYHTPFTKWVIFMLFVNSMNFSLWKKIVNWKLKKRKKRRSKSKNKNKKKRKSAQPAPPSLLSQVSRHCHRCNSECFTFTFNIKLIKTTINYLNLIIHFLNFNQSYLDED